MESDFGRSESSQETTVFSRVAEYATTRNMLIFVLVLIVVFLLYKYSKGHSTTPQEVKPDENAAVVLDDLEKTGAVVVGN